MTVIQLIGLALALVVGAMLAAPQVRAYRALSKLRVPDGPLPFAPGVPWLAIRSTRTRDIARKLDLVEARPANWGHGLGPAIGQPPAPHAVFVTPPVDGWTLVVGESLPSPLSARFIDKWSPLLIELSQQFGEVQFFHADNLVDLYAWARAVDGKLARVFVISDEGVLWNQGRLTKDEKSLELRVLAVKAGAPRAQGNDTAATGDLFGYPTPEHVARLAGHWSLDPTRLAASAARPGVGILGRSPGAWRPERAHGTAR